jgi:hypothetical protein
MMLTSVEQLMAATGCTKERAAVRLSLRLWKIGAFFSARLKPIFVRDCDLGINASIYSLKRRADSYSKVLACMFDSLKLNAVDCHRDKSSAVFAALLLERRPSAIFRGIVFAWVEAINRMIGRRLSPHVGQERCEVVNPPIAYSYASAAPIVIVFALRVIASALHCKPSFVFNTNRFSAFFTVFCNSSSALVNKLAATSHFSSPLLCEASARLCSSGLSQVRAGRKDDIAAIAQAFPHFWRVVFFKNCKTPKPLASNVNEFHGYILGGT